MNFVIPAGPRRASWALALMLSSCVLTEASGGAPEGPPARPGIDPSEPSSARLLAAAPERVLEAARHVFDDLGWTRQEGAGQDQVLAASPVERRFMSLIGEQEKSTLATFGVTPVATGVTGTRSAARVSLELLRGPAGRAPTERVSFRDPAWEDDFFTRIRAELDAAAQP